jgi:hypothetical protein
MLKFFVHLKIYVSIDLRYTPFGANVAGKGLRVITSLILGFGRPGRPPRARPQWDYVCIANNVGDYYSLHACIARMGS